MTTSTESPIRILSPLDMRIPSWPRAHLSPRPCPVCAQEGWPYCVRPDGLDVNRCGQCGAYYISPAPSAEELAALYAAYYDSHYVRTAVQVDPLRELLARFPQADVRLRLLTRHIRLAGARLLDIGCGVGTTLRQCARLGAQVSGVDTDGSVIAMLRAQYGFTDVCEGDFLALPLHGLFDVVIMYDIIEHPLNPLDWLRKAAAALVPGGVLVIWTPNGAAVERDPRCLPFRVDLEHLQYLTPSTMRYLAQMLNLEILHLQTLGYPNLADRLSGAARLLRKVSFAARSFLFPAAGDYNLFCLLQRPG